MEDQSRNFPESRTKRQKNIKKERKDKCPIFSCKINPGGIIFTKFQEEKKPRKMEGSELLKRLYRPCFQNSRTQASDLKGLSKCVGQSKNKDSYEDILLRDFLNIKRYGKDSFVFFFVCFGCAAWLARSQFPDMGLNPGYDCEIAES